LRLDEELTQPSEGERALQTLLNAAGFEVEVDGFAGPQTIAALNEFVAGVFPRESKLAPGDVVDKYILDMLGQVSE
jgi:peptidoglycan hydrolase-like protein with peptidoglycan-binding domain